MLRYRIDKGDGRFLLVDEKDHVQRDHVRIALMIDVDHGVLHKHGAPKAVQRHFDRWNRLMGDATGAFRCVMITLPEDFPVDELNACLSTSGYVGLLVDKYGWGNE